MQARADTSHGALFGVTALALSAGNAPAAATAVNAAIPAVRMIGIISLLLRQLDGCSQLPEHSAP
jgi:hypothetical protein